MYRRTIRLALVATSVACAAAVISGGASVAATKSTSVTVRTLPGIVGSTSPSATTNATNTRDLVVAATNHKTSGRTVKFYQYSTAKKAYVYKKSVKTNAAGEASYAGVGFAKYRWKVVASSTRTTRSATASMSRAAGWSQTFVDDFSGTALGPQWRSRYDHQWIPGRTCTYASMDQVAVGSGHLSMSTQRISSTQPSRIAGHKPSSSTFKSKCKDKSGKPYVYESSAIDTAVPNLNRFTMARGVVAARVKTSPLPGQHGAVWLPAPKVHGTEIDIMESNGNYTDKVGHRPIVAGIYYGKTGKVQQVVRDSYKTWSSNYHVFSVEWTTKQYIFRIDSRVVLRTAKGLTADQHHLALTNFVADWEISRNSGARSTMSVDWIKAWQK